METGFEPAYTDLQSVASPLGHSTLGSYVPPASEWGALLPIGIGRDWLRADDGIRTRDPHLGKVMLYQLSHVRSAPFNDRSPSVRSRTIAERSIGVQTLGPVRAPPFGAPIMINRRGYPSAMQFLTSPSAASVGHRAVWANGRLYDDPAEARVVVTDHGLVAGAGVFETMRVTDEGPFAVQRHLNRLSRSASALGMPPPDHARIRAAVDAVLDGQVMSRGRLRITYTGGPGPLSSAPAYGPPTLVVAVEATDFPVASTAIVTAPWTRNEHGALSGVKSTSYAENVRGLAYASSRSATEAIFPNTAGNVCEGTGTNIFMVFGGRVVTPPLGAGPLAGITREVILEWCEVEERDVTLAQAKAADEVFLTSSLRDVQAVHSWDEMSYSQSHPVTDQVSDTFARNSLANLDP